MRDSIMELESLRKRIYELENKLLKPETRQASEKISELLADDFIEFCSSGKVYHYSKGDVWDNDSNSSELKWEIIEFEIKQLSKDSILATYKLIKHSESDETKKHSLRSSIWKLSSDRWKMVFHQGTVY